MALLLPQEKLLQYFFINVQKHTRGLKLKMVTSACPNNFRRTKNQLDRYQKIISRTWMKYQTPRITS